MEYNHAKTKDYIDITGGMWFDCVSVVGVNVFQCLSIFSCLFALKYWWWWWCVWGYAQSPHQNGSYSFCLTNIIITITTNTTTAIIITTKQCFPIAVKNMKGNEQSTVALCYNLCWWCLHVCTCYWELVKWITKLTIENNNRDRQIDGQRQLVHQRNEEEHS